MLVCSFAGQMKRISKEDIELMDRLTRINLMNSITGYKPANLIGSADKQGRTNLAIISSVIHMGSSPALIGFIMRPPSVSRHTYDNIKATGEYTINHVHEYFIEKAHYTSAKFAKDESEFDHCGLEADYINGHSAPFVKQSKVRLAMRFVSEKPIEENGTILIIGEVNEVHFPEDAQLETGDLDLTKINDVCISGLNAYHVVSEPVRFPYARKEQMPDFSKTRPDQVVYDEETGKYNASLLPYATSVSGPSFKANDLTLWKNNSAGKVSAHFKTRFEEIKAEYKSMVDQFSWNEIVYTAKFSFEPIVGQEYHLYERENGERFLSMIPPESWSKQHLGTFVLSSDKMWMKNA